jgi:hypothetical protein
VLNLPTWPKVRSLMSLPVNERSSVQLRPPSGCTAPASSRMITLVPALGETTMRDESAAGHAFGSARSKIEAIEKSEAKNWHSKLLDQTGICSDVLPKFFASSTLPFARSTTASHLKPSVVVPA